MTELVCKKCKAPIHRSKATMVKFMKCPECGALNSLPKIGAPRKARPSRLTKTPLSQENAPVKIPLPDELLTCAICTKKVLGNAEYYSECENEGFTVNREMGTVEVVALKTNDVLKANMMKKIAERKKLELDNNRAFKCERCRVVYCQECIIVHTGNSTAENATCPSCKVNTLINLFSSDASKYSDSENKAIQKSDSAIHRYECPQCRREQEFWKTPDETPQCKYCTIDMTKIT